MRSQLLLALLLALSPLASSKTDAPKNAKTAARAAKNPPKTAKASNKTKAPAKAAGTEVKKKSPAAKTNRSPATSNRNPTNSSRSNANGGSASNANAGGSARRRAVAEKLNWQSGGKAAAGLAAGAAAGAAAAANYDRSYSNGDDVGLIINNKAIGKNELLREIAVERRAAPADMSDRVLTQQIIEETIRRELLRELAQRAEVSADEREIEAAVKQIAAQNKVSEAELLQQVRRDTGLSPEQYKERLAESVLEEKMKMEAIGPEISVSDEEVDDQIAQLAYKQGSSLEVEDLLLPLPPGTPEERAPKIKQVLKLVSDALAKSGNSMQRAAALIPQARFNNLGAVDLQQAPPRFARVLANLPVGEVSSTPVIDSDGMHFLRVARRDTGQGGATMTEAAVLHIMVRGDDQRAKEKVDSIYRALQGGESFGALAQRYSDDSSSAVKGGDMGYVNAGEVGEDFSKAMEQAPLNQLVPPFKSSSGWHIIVVKDRRQVDGSEALLRQRIRMALFAQRLENRWQQYMQQLRQNAFVKINL